MLNLFKIKPTNNMHYDMNDVSQRECLNSASVQELTRATSVLNNFFILSIGELLL